MYIWLWPGSFLLEVIMRCEWFNLPDLNIWYSSCIPHERGSTYHSCLCPCASPGTLDCSSSTPMCSPSYPLCIAPFHSDSSTSLPSYCSIQGLLWLWKQELAQSLPITLVWDLHVAPLFIVLLWFTARIFKITQRCGMAQKSVIGLSHSAAISAARSRSIGVVRMVLVVCSCLLHELPRQ